MFRGGNNQPTQIFHRSCTNTCIKHIHLREVETRMQQEISFKVRILLDDESKKIKSRDI